MIDGGYLNNVVCATSSHFSSAERQYRYPLELGSTRPPQSQWTVTGAGACVLSTSGVGPKITGATIGRVVDYGVTDTIVATNNYFSKEATLLAVENNVMLIDRDVLTSLVKQTEVKVSATASKFSCMSVNEKTKIESKYPYMI